MLNNIILNNEKNEAEKLYVFDFYARFSLYFFFPFFFVFKGVGDQT